MKYIKHFVFEESGTLGGAEHRNIAENIEKYHNTENKNRQISQYRIESR